MPANRENQRPADAGVIRLLLPALAVALLLLGAACTPADPVEQRQQVRAEYTVEVSSFFVREEPLEAVEPEADAEGEEEIAETDDEVAATDDAEAEAQAPVPTKQVLSLDLLVSTTTTTPLEGITVEFEHVDSSQNVKDTRSLWLDVTGVQKGSSATKTIRVDDVEYVEGDGFRVSVRSPVPASEFSNYPEFEGVGGP